MSSDQVVPGAATSVRDMLARGYILGIGESAVLGWFKPGKPDEGEPRWIPWSSLRPEERAWVFAQECRFGQVICNQAEIKPGTLYATVEIVSSPA